MSMRSSAFVPKRDVYLGLAEGWARLCVRCSVFPSVGVMQQPTSRQLYAYWDRVRNGRVAPRRFEIEPAKIAALLPQTFIAENAGMLSYRFRLAGTKICEQFGRELRGADLLGLWDAQGPRCRRLPAPQHLRRCRGRLWTLPGLCCQRPGGELRARLAAADPRRGRGQSHSRRRHGHRAAVLTGRGTAAAPRARRAQSTLGRRRAGLHGARRRRGHQPGPAALPRRGSRPLQRRIATGNKRRLLTNIVLVRTLSRSLTELRLAWLRTCHLSCHCNSRR